MKATITEIKNSAGQQNTIKKLNGTLNGSPAYYVNGVLMTKANMVESYQRGDLF